MRGGETFESEDKTFTTQGVGGEVTLPDHRQWELASPPNKDGGRVFGITAKEGVVIGATSAVQAAAEGDGITYLMSAPGETKPAGNAAATQVLSTRTESGEGREAWSSQDISPAHKNLPILSLNLGEAYRFFSSNLSHGLLQENDDTPVVLRDNGAGIPETEAFETLVTSKLPQPVEFEAATPDLSHILLDTSGESTNGLYEWSKEDGEQKLETVNIGTKGEVVPGGFLGGYVNGDRPSQFAGRHAVSDDGSRMVWGTGSELFTRDMPTERTVQVDAAAAQCVSKGEEGECESGGGVFQLASSDGTRVFFTDAHSLMTGAVPDSLYMFDVLTGKLNDLTPGVAPGVLGANEAGTLIYVLSGNNIELLRESSAGSGSWTPSLIATLSASDDHAYYFGSGLANPQILAHWPVRVSPNGEYFAFMSDRSLTGYDNIDAGEAEVLPGEGKKHADE
jgi:hypothetical protein